MDQEATLRKFQSPLWCLSGLIEVLPDQLGKGVWEGCHLPYIHQTLFPPSSSHRGGEGPAKTSVDTRRYGLD